MKGIHRIIVQNKRIRYDFELRRNLTVIRGDSATGKTTLIDMIQEYINLGNDSSIELTCDKACYVLEGVTWRGQLSVIKDSIVFVDEGNAFVFSDEFSEVIQKTDNYYVIVSREGLPNLPYSVSEIYGIRMSGRYGGLKQTFNEFYRIYGGETLTEDVRPDVVVTEDTNAGFQFYEHVCSDSGIKCYSSGGKANIIQSASQWKDSDVCVLLIADGAAFGSEMDRAMWYLQNHWNIRLYLPESFEWLILSANPMHDAEIANILGAPSDHIDSGEYYSWERYFTRLLTDTTQGTYLHYSKNRINPAYLSGAVQRAILEEMKYIVLT